MIIRIVFIVALISVLVGCSFCHSTSLDDAMCCQRAQIEDASKYYFIPFKSSWLRKSTEDAGFVLGISHVIVNWSCIIKSNNENVDCLYSQEVYPSQAYYIDSFSCYWYIDIESAERIAMHYLVDVLDKYGSALVNTGIQDIASESGFTLELITPSFEVTIEVIEVQHEKDCFLEQRPLLSVSTHCIIPLFEVGEDGISP